MRSEFFNLKMMGGTEVTVQIIHLEDSAFVYIGGEDMKFSNAVVAIQTKYEQIPALHKYMTEMEEGIHEIQIENMAKSLCKKTGKVIHLSINVLPQEESDLRTIQAFLLEKLKK